ncbi:MAG TPA: hypothetical protein VK205_14490, partial [Prolixibacteraceae bacterium]|nr:hypothetical protein [Prolixibacteraceae bacterium]
MKISNTIKTALLMTSVVLVTLNASGQKDTVRLRQEVEVSKNYQPTVSEAEKINDIPKIKTEQTEPPTFDYSIFSKPVYSNFDLTPVAAAKMVGESKPEMENGLLKLGIGNYYTPYGELFYNVQPEKNSNFGMHFKHLSSWGKIKLLNDDKVKAPRSENVAELFGQKFFRRSTLTGRVSYDRNAFNYYGYPGDQLSDEQKQLMIPYFGDKQHFSQGTFDVNLKSGKAFADNINYDLGFNYHYFVTKTAQKEHQTVFSADLNKKFNSTIGLLNTSLTYYRAEGIKNRISNLGQKQQVLLRIDPSVMWKTENAKLQLGVNTALLFDDDTNGSGTLFPKVNAEWSPVKQVLTLFAGADGYLQHNTYSAIAAENPYVDPLHDIKNAKVSYLLSGGIKGKLSSKTNFVTQASYSLVKDQHFYITRATNFNNPNATVQSLDNTFDVVYDDVNVFKLSAELLHSVSENFSLHLVGNYYSYTLNTIEKAWQMPNFDFTFSGIYKPTEQLKFNADIFIVGERTALITEAPSSSVPGIQVSMDPIID